MLVEQLVENGAILEGAVHSLAVKGNHCVGGIAEKQRLASGMPLEAAHRAQGSRGMGQEIVAQTGDEGQRVRKFGCEEVQDALFVPKRFKAQRTRIWQKQSAGEAAASVGERDQHEAAARPDVQSVLFQLAGAVRSRRDSQLLVAMRQMLVAALDLSLLDHRVADHGTRAVRRDYRIEGLPLDRPVFFVSQE